jgi:hypothetical protein
MTENYRLYLEGRKAHLEETRDYLMSESEEFVYLEDFTFRKRDALMIIKDELEYTNRQLGRLKGERW